MGNINLQALNTFMQAFANPVANEADQNKRAEFGEQSANQGGEVRFSNWGTNKVSRAFRRVFSPNDAENLRLKDISRQFHQSVKDIFAGGPIPRSILDALGVHTLENGIMRPLTARRIAIVKNALNNLGEVRSKREELTQVMNSHSRELTNEELIYLDNIGVLQRPQPPNAGGIPQNPPEIQEEHPEENVPEEHPEENAQEKGGGVEKNGGEPQPQPGVNNVDFNQLDYVKSQPKLNAAEDTFRDRLFQKLGGDRKKTSIDAAFNTYVNNPGGPMSKLKDAFRGFLGQMTNSDKAVVKAFENWFKNFVGNAFDSAKFALSEANDNSRSVFESALDLSERRLTDSELADKLLALDVGKYVDDLCGTAMDELNEAFGAFLDCEKKGGPVDQAGERIDKGLTEALKGLNVTEQERAAIEKKIAEQKKELLEAKLDVVVMGEEEELAKVESEIVGKLATTAGKLIRGSRRKTLEQKVYAAILDQVKAKAGGWRERAVAYLLNRAGRPNLELDPDELKAFLAPPLKFSDDDFVKALEDAGELREILEQQLRGNQDAVTAYIEKNTLDESLLKFDDAAFRSCAAEADKLFGDEALGNRPVRDPGFPNAHTAKALVEERVKYVAIVRSTEFTEKVEGLGYAFFTGKAAKLVGGDNWLGGSEKKEAFVNGLMKDFMSALHNTAKTKYIQSRDKDNPALMKFTHAGNRFMEDCGKVLTAFDKVFRKMAEETTQTHGLFSNTAWLTDKNGGKARLAGLLAEKAMAICRNLVTNPDKYYSFDNPQAGVLLSETVLRYDMEDALKDVATDSVLKPLLPKPGKGGANPRLDEMLSIK